MSSVARIAHSTAAMIMRYREDRFLNHQRVMQMHQYDRYELCEVRPFDVTLGYCDFDGKYYVKSYGYKAEENISECLKFLRTRKKHKLSAHEYCKAHKVGYY